MPMWTLARVQHSQRRGYRFARFWLYARSCVFRDHAQLGGKVIGADVRVVWARLSTVVR